jgi:hypothetical protein
MEIFFTYIGQGDSSNDDKDNLSSNMLILFAEPLSLQCTDRDGQSTNEVEEDQSRIYIVEGPEGSPELADLSKRHMPKVET